MNPVIKGGMIAAFLISALVAYWIAFSPSLSVNRDPEQYAFIAKMEKDGPPDFELPVVAYPSGRSSGSSLIGGADGRSTGKPNGSPGVILDGTRFRLSSLRGKAVVVNFWASWCNPCVEEFPSLLKLASSLKGDVQLVAVSGDEDPADIASFLKAFGAPGPNVHIVWDKGRKVADSWGVGKIPESFLLGRDGRLARKVLGSEDWATAGALDYFKELIAAPSKSP